MQNQPSRALVVLMAYCLVFYTIWALLELQLKLGVDHPYASWPEAFLKSGLIKCILWALPVVYLLHRYNDLVAISLKEMFTNKVRWGQYLPLFALFTIYIGIGSLLQHGVVSISPSFSPKDLVMVLFVGITEELVYRGWLLNITVKMFNKARIWLAIAINAVMFLLIHFPIWLSVGEFTNMFTSLGFLSVLALSVIFSVTFLKSRSIWPPIALHMYWDLLMILFI